MPTYSVKLNTHHLFRTEKTWKTVDKQRSRARNPERHLSLGLQPKEVPSQLAEISHHLRDAHL